MARIETDPNYSNPTFPRADAATDLFKKEDVQKLAQAVSTHNHTNGYGVLLPAGAIPAGSIDASKIADGTVGTAELADGSITSAKIADGTIQNVDIADGAVTQWQTYQAIPSFSSTTTGAYVATPVTFSFTTTGGRLQLWCSGAVVHSAAPGALIRVGIMRDSVFQAALSVYHNQAANQAIPFAFVFSDLPTAAAHTYTLALYNATAGTMSLDGGTTASMIATEFKR